MSARLSWLSAIVCGGALLATAATATAAPCSASTYGSVVVRAQVVPRGAAGTIRVFIDLDVPNVYVPAGQMITVTLKRLPAPGPIPAIPEEILHRELPLKTGTVEVPPFTDRPDLSYRIQLEGKFFQILYGGSVTLDLANLRSAGPYKSECHAAEVRPLSVHATNRGPVEFRLFSSELKERLAGQALAKQCASCDRGTSTADDDNTDAHVDFFVHNHLSNWIALDQTDPIPTSGTPAFTEAFEIFEKNTTRTGQKASPFLSIRILPTGK